VKQPKQAKAPRGQQHPVHPLPAGKPASKQGKPATQHASRQRVPPAVQHARHRAAVKAAQTRARNAKTKKAAKPRQLALAGAVACCTAEALAASLRLTGRPVTGADVLALYRRTADSPDAGASIVATLDAALAYGLAGVHPVAFAAVDAGDPAAVILGLDLPAPHAVCDDGTGWWSWGQRWAAADFPDAVISEAWAVTW
jgi:hypothetical protein